MNIPWKLKSFVFGFIDYFNASELLYFLQKNVTGRSLADKSLSPEIWEGHKKYLVKYGAHSKIFEFGGGKSLAQNLFLSDTVQSQIVVDLNPMLDFGLVNSVREILSEIVSLKSKSPIENLSDLEKYGIKYKAPFDAAKTDFDEKIFDACISTNTLEHIPGSNIVEIFCELHRTLKDGGIVSARIDYSDHYAHTDSNITLLNYLKFCEPSWKKYNHQCHYQNRLRHYDYIRIFEDSGFKVVEEMLIFDEKNIPQELENRFAGYDETWKATAAHIVLKKA